jgi:hypothetical protein
MRELLVHGLRKEGWKYKNIATYLHLSENHCKKLEKRFKDSIENEQIHELSEQRKAYLRYYLIEKNSFLKKEAKSNYLDSSGSTLSKSEMEFLSSELIYYNPSKQESLSNFRDDTFFTSKANSETSSETTSETLPEKHVLIEEEIEKLEQEYEVMATYEEYLEEYRLSWGAKLSKIEYEELYL